MRLHRIRYPAGPALNIDLGPESDRSAVSAGGRAGKGRKGAFLQLTGANSRRRSLIRPCRTKRVRPGPAPSSTLLRADPRVGPIAWTGGGWDTPVVHRRGKKGLTAGLERGRGAVVVSLLGALVVGLVSCSSSPTAATSPGAQVVASSSPSQCHQPGATKPVTATPVAGVPSDWNVTSFDGTVIRAHWFPADLGRRTAGAHRPDGTRLEPGRRHRRHRERGARRPADQGLAPVRVQRAHLGSPGLRTIRGNLGGRQPERRSARREHPDQLGRGATWGAARRAGRSPDGDGRRILRRRHPVGHGGDRLPG